MEKVLESKKHEFQRLERQDLKMINGGADPYTVASLTIAAVGLWVIVCDAVEDAGEAIGKALAK